VTRRHSRAALSLAPCALSALSALSAACAVVDTAERAAGGDPPAVGDPRADTVAAIARGSAAAAVREPGALATVAAAPVSGWTGPGGQPFEVTLRTADPAAAHARRFGTVTLRTALRARAPDLGQYPCTSCHMGRKVVMADERVADAHRDIEPAHPRQTGAACATCHAPDDVERLALRSGERATLDHTYRLCAQCHFVQADAWAVGAHGKRLDGWQGRRVVLGCADCHDPHDPTLEARVPFRAPRLARPRSHGR
jgi:hypothetical protein